MEQQKSPKDHGEHAAQREDWRELARRVWERPLRSAPLYAQLLQHCRAHGLRERQLWQRLTLYRQGKEEKLRDWELGWSWFGGQEEKLHHRIVQLIGRLPPETLEDFRQCVCFTESLLERVSFVCDLAAWMFCEREKGPRRESTDTRPYTEYLLEKLCWELELLRQMEEHGIGELNDRYQQWLGDKSLDQEALV